jgi:7-cyano-7-deazaguanine reductase
MAPDEVLYGERQIAENELLPIPNPAPQRHYLITHDCPEFTCLCPRSGFPDFATIHIEYVPDGFVAELKSLKLYINGFRDRHVFHEAVVNLILDDLVRTVSPLWMKVVGDFNVRGNIKTVITAEHGRRPEAI